MKTKAIKKVPTGARVWHGWPGSPFGADLPYWRLRIWCSCCEKDVPLLIAANYPREKPGERAKWIRKVAINQGWSNLSGELNCPECVEITERLERNERAE